MERSFKTDRALCDGAPYLDLVVTEEVSSLRDLIPRSAPNCKAIDVQGFLAKLRELRDEAS